MLHFTILAVIAVGSIHQSSAGIESSIFEQGGYNHGGHDFVDLGTFVGKHNLPPKVIRVVKTVAIKVPHPYPVKVPQPYPVPKPYPVYVTKYIKQEVPVHHDVGHSGGGDQGGYGGGGQGFGHSGGAGEGFGHSGGAGEGFGHSGGEGGGHGGVSEAESHDSYQNVGDHESGGGGGGGDGGYGQEGAYSGGDSYSHEQHSGSSGYHY